MENLNDINNLDPNDEGLKSIMGSRFHDITEPMTAARPAKKAAPAPADTDEEYAPAETAYTDPLRWAPPKPAPNWLDRLKACAKWSLTFGGLCLLFFYWQQTGLMDPAAALPSMLACTLIGGWGIGKHATK